MLATGRVRLHNNIGVTIFARVLFDTGAETNLIIEKCAIRAELPRQQYTVEIEGITGVQTVDLGLINAKISPWYEVTDDTHIYIRHSLFTR